MITLNECKKDWHECLNCQAQNGDTPVYTISVQVDTQGSSMRLCKNCLEELINEAMDRVFTRSEK